MMVQVRYTSGMCQFVQAEALKVAANGLLYIAMQHKIFVVDEVLSYASIN